MPSKSNFEHLPLIILILASLLILTTCTGTNQLKIKDSSPSIPLERIDLNGKYNSSGLAKRVTEALKKDPMLTSVFSIYVAQTGSKIILKGTVSSQIFLDRIITVAGNVRGVTEVDPSLVEIR